jgi:hypothetical protein
MPNGTVADMALTHQADDGTDDGHH